MLRTGIVGGNTGDQARGFNPSILRVTAVCVTLVCTATPSLAETNTTDLEVIEEIVVIGSRIKRRDYVAPSPVSTIDRETLRFAIQPTLEESLNQMPQVTPDFDRTANNPGDGTARVNLRGLGSGRTLVLLNGRRLAPSGVGSSVDINTIPQALVDRIEIVTGGTTTVYGSDAIAGVVNLVTREDFEGFGLDTSYYITEEGDSDIFDLSASYGGDFAGDRGHLVFFGGYYDREDTLAGERKITATTWEDIDGEIVQSGNNRVPAGAILFPLADLGEGPVRISFDPDGNPVPFREPEDRYDTAPPSYLQTPLRRYSGGLFLDYDFNEQHSSYAEVLYTRNESSQSLSPIGVGGFYDTNFDNPVLTAEAQQIFADSYIPSGGNVVSYFLGRRLVELGSRTIDNTRDYTRVVAGFRGELSSNWNYDTWITYTDSDEKSLLRNDASESRLRQGLLVDPATGQCFDPSNGCVPIDLFGPGRISTAAAAFIGFPPLTNKSSREQKLASAYINGTPFNSWAGEIETAFGIEWREDSGEFTADEALFTGDSLGYRGDSAVDGTESVFEVFGEALIPILQDAAFAEYLALEVGARYSEYRHAGSVNTYKYGGEWLPVEGVRFRAMYQRSVRAPNLSEAFQEQFTEIFPYVGNDSSEDPCSASADPIGNGRLEKCVITGLPVNQVGVFEANIAVPTDNVFGGNPDLDPEKADTTTVGVVLSPLALQDFTVSIDYFDLKVEGTIGELEPTLACFDPLNTSGEFCNTIRRNSTTYDVDEVLQISYNRGALRTKGFDSQLSFQTALPEMLAIFNDAADLKVNLIWTHVLENTIQETPTGTELRCDGHFGYPCDTYTDGQTYPDDRISAFINYRSGDLGLHLAWKWIGGTKNAELLVPDFLGGPAPVLAIDEIGSRSYVDLGLSYSFSDQVSARFNVANLLNTNPPFMADAVLVNNTDTRMFDVFQRSYSLSLSLRH